jgi:pimeloyl-ACP methyl ester carboxylesterase
MPRAPKPDKHTPAPLETVSPVWLVKAIAVVVLAALLCGYLTFCLLFYQGQWQLVLHPTRTSTNPQSIAGVPYQIVRFGPDESATPQLVGWSIPSDPGGRYASLTILFLPDGNGSLADSIPTLASLHNLGINVFAFDYRGYGQSNSVRPNQQTLTHDAQASLQYLTGTRSIPSQRIVPYGVGVGTSLATQLAISNPAIPAIILDAPRADLLDVARRDSRSTFIPVRLLFHDRFPLAEPLNTLRIPKLLISRSTALDQTFRNASDPKLTVELAYPNALVYNQSLTRFLDQYLGEYLDQYPEQSAHPANSLVPSLAPVP